MSSGTWKWATVEQSVCGASHSRDRLPNQDAIKIYSKPDGGPPLVVAVSDGHGSPRCFRSHVGARLATEAATVITCELLSKLASSQAPTIKSEAEGPLAGSIIKEWRRRVEQDIEQRQFTPEERDRLGLQEGLLAAERLQRSLLAYGATLLLVAVGTDANGRDFAFFLQLGDGDILAVSDRTNQVEYAVTADATLMANETTSLCMDHAQNMFRFKFQDIQEEPPALILAATDGYFNSFATPDDFKKVGTDLLEIIKREGLDYVRAHLEEWLDATTRSGSGDDVTLGIICRTDLIDQRPKAQEFTPTQSPGSVVTSLESPAVANHEEGRDSE